MTYDTFRSIRNICIRPSRIALAGVCFSSFPGLKFSQKLVNRHATRRDTVTTGGPHTFLKRLYTLCRRAETFDAVARKVNNSYSLTPFRLSCMQSASFKEREYPLVATLTNTLNRSRKFMEVQVCTCQDCPAREGRTICS